MTFLVFGLHCREEAAASSTSEFQARVEYETRNSGKLNKQTTTRTEPIFAIGIWNDSRSSLKQSAHLMRTLEKIATIENMMQLSHNDDNTPPTKKRNVFSWYVASPRQIGRHSDHHEWATDISTAASNSNSAEILKQNKQQSQG